jgi:hypothetical protein
MIGSPGVAGKRSEEAIETTGFHAGAAEEAEDAAGGTYRFTTRVIPSLRCNELKFNSSPTRRSSRRR